MELFRVVGTKLCRSSTYHLQFDGQTEVVNRFLEAYLRCFCRLEEWEAWLSYAEYWYNATCHSPIGMSPFQAVHGRVRCPLMFYGDDPTVKFFP